MKNEDFYNDGNRSVRPVGEPTAGGAHAHYEIIKPIVEDPEAHPGDVQVLAEIRFQHDTIPAVGVVGATNECLLAIVRDRLEAFENGSFPCLSNGIAKQLVNGALLALESRTADRKHRGVEGKHEA